MITTVTARDTVLPVTLADAKTHLRIVGEDLDDLGEDIARLAHRSMEQTDQNPLYGQVQTIADLVHFIQHQPRLSA